MVIRRVEPLTAAKVMTLIYVAIGLIPGVIVAALSVLPGLATTHLTGLGFGAGFGIAAIIILPLVYGCVGFVMTMIVTAVYNVAAGIVGGIEIQTD